MFIDTGTFRAITGQNAQVQSELSYMRGQMARLADVFEDFADASGTTRAQLPPAAARRGGARHARPRQGHLRLVQGGLAVTARAATCARVRPQASGRLRRSSRPRADRAGQPRLTLPEAVGGVAANHSRVNGLIMLASGLPTTARHARPGRAKLSRRWSLIVLAVILAAWLAAAFTAGRVVQSGMVRRAPAGAVQGGPR